MTDVDHDRDFDAFVRSTWRSLRQAAFALTGNTADAEDLLQSVLANAYARWPRLRRDDPVAYVRRALVNRYIDTWRRRNVVREMSRAEPPERTSYDELDRFDDRDDLATLLAALSPRERTVVVMRHYLDLSERDVAVSLGCSVGTVKSTCSRALQRLRVPVTARPEEQP